MLHFLCTFVLELSVKKKGTASKNEKETFIFVSENSLTLRDTYHRIPLTSVFKTPPPT